MTGIIWWIVQGLAVAWLLSCLFVLALGVAAHRGVPSIVADDPWAGLDGPDGWDRLRTAVLEAQLDSSTETAPRHPARRRRPAA